MCQDCWEEYGSPKIVTEATQAAAALIARVYEFSDVGGNLHCELDDWNIADEFFKGGFDPDLDESGPAQVAAERACYDALKAMTLPERASALAICRRYFAIETTHIH